MKRPLTAEQLLQLRKNGADREALLQQAQASMNASQKAQLDQLLQDKDALQKLLNSEQAQNILRQWKKNG